MEHVCFGCGKPGHIQINCPQKKAKSCAAAAVRIQKEADTGTTGNVAPADEAQEGETPPEDDDAEREYYSLGEEDLPQVTPGEDEFPPSQYNWDDEDDDAGSSFRANALSTPAMGYCVRKSHVVTCDKKVITTTCGLDRKSWGPALARDPQVTTTTCDANHKSQSRELACNTQDTTMTCGPDHKSMPDIRLQVGVTTGGKPPLYDHRA